MTNHIVLYQPEIPQNTGNIARTCVGTNTHLHLIRPLGFSVDDKHLKRAGCDYWDDLNVHYYDDVHEFFAQNPVEEIYYIETFGTEPYHKMNYNTGKDIYLMFGRESTGIPKEVIEQYGGSERCVLIPQSDKVRSLNLSNTAAIVIYEVLRQQDFAPLRG